MLEVGVVEVLEGVLECWNHHWTILKQYLIQNCTCKMRSILKFAVIMIPAEVLEVEVVNVSRVS